MFNDSKWQKVSGADVEPFLNMINPISSKYTAAAQTATVEWRQLPFYTNIGLVRVQDKSWGADAGPFWFLAKQGRMFHLDGTSAPIHEANEAGPIKVTGDTALEYLRFFCFFVHGEDGPFLILESVEDEAIDQARLDDTTRGIIEGAVLPASYEGEGEEGGHLANAVVLYGDALFSARFSMSEDGMIEMIDDDPIAADLPVRKFRSKV